MTRPLASYLVAILGLSMIAVVGFAAIVNGIIRVASGAMVADQSVRSATTALKAETTDARGAMIITTGHTAPGDRQAIVWRPAPGEDAPPALPTLIPADVVSEAKPFSQDEMAKDPAAKFYGSASGTYRTVCVRLCDGYHWPISFATAPSRFAADAARCDNACGSPTRLFVMTNPGGTAENMVDLDGKPYSRLSTAFRFRTSFDASCKCNAHPWQEEARDRHQVYVLEAAIRKGDQRAAKPLVVVKAKVEEAKKRTVEQKAVATGKLTTAGIMAPVDRAKVSALFPSPKRGGGDERIRVASTEPVRYASGGYGIGSGGGSWQARAFVGN